MKGPQSLGSIERGWGALFIGKWNLRCLHGDWCWPGAGRPPGGHREEQSVSLLQDPQQASVASASVWPRQQCPAALSLVLGKMMTGFGLNTTSPLPQPSRSCSAWPEAGQEVPRARCSGRQPHWTWGAGRPDQLSAPTGPDLSHSLELTWKLGRKSIIQAYAVAGTLLGCQGRERQHCSWSFREKCLYWGQYKELAAHDQLWASLPDTAASTPLSRLVITFLPSNKHLLISWLQSPSNSL